VTLYVGSENWPLPIPLVEYNKQWYFDPELGKQEVLYRRVGRNEVAALDVCQALVDAEKEYFGVAHNYTAKFVSAADAHDGLYWKAGQTNTRSPVGPYLAEAGVTNSTQNRQPFQGYYYRIVLQGSSGAENAGGNSAAAGMGGQSGAAGTGHFLVVAFPAEYRSSGVMTFVMDESGVAYEKDLGPHTKDTAMQVSAGPDNTWTKVE
jgi:hypothetical protein